MKVSLSWLSDYVSVEMETNRLADALTMAGLEVDSVSDRYRYLDSVFVGRIASVDPHPNADKLTLCQVEVGDRRLSVVCGAPNVAAQMLAPVALPGTEFPNGNVLESSSIRGVVSEGMLCSEAELGLGGDHSGIMVLDHHLAVGEKLAAALDLSDAVLTLDLTPNRPDCLSIIGVAREVAAIQKTPLTYPQTTLSDDGDDINGLTSITINDPDHCPRYTARLVDGIQIQASPFWLQEKLLSVGQRPINNVVDVTNFVMLEMGQPLHAFDYERLGENRIVVRTAEDGETFVTLDEKERKLTGDMLMICDGIKPVAVGGVMGGANSEIVESTTRVLIESAYFNPMSIRKTSKKLGLTTEASHRFERGVDPEGAVPALNRTARLIAETGGGKIVSGLIDAYPLAQTAKTIDLNPGRVNRILGTSLESSQMKQLLESVEFTVAPGQDERLVVGIPPFRVDVARQEDLAEEVARLWGYNNIETTFPSIAADQRHPLLALELRNQYKRLMTGLGFTETINYSFVNRISCDQLLLQEDDPRRNMVAIVNPLTEDQEVMRTSMLPGLIETMKRNLAQQNRRLKIFEIGRTFLPIDPDALPEEIEVLAGLWTGPRNRHSWHGKQIAGDFYDLKGAVESLLRALKIEPVRFSQITDEIYPYLRPGYRAQISSDNRLIGVMGELHPEVQKRFDLDQTAFVFELNLRYLQGIIPQEITSTPISKFPPVDRDITLIVDRETESGEIVEQIEAAHEALVDKVYLFDIFEGKPIPRGKKSVSVRIVYRSDSKTLEDEQVTKIHEGISARLVDAFDAQLPT
jgi:phenylalanyl-tRNA synthetase beta chain